MTAGVVGYSTWALSKKDGHTLERREGTPRPVWRTAGAADVKERPMLRREPHSRRVVPTINPMLMPGADEWKS